MHGPTLTFRAERIEDVARLYVAGEIDFATADSLVAHATAVMDHPAPRRLTLDLAGVTFCASAGVSALVTICRQAAELDMGVDLANAAEELQRVLSLTGVDELFGDHATGGPPGELPPHPPV